MVYARWNSDTEFVVPQGVPVMPCDTGTPFVPHLWKPRKKAVCAKDCSFKSFSPLSAGCAAGLQCALGRFHTLGTGFLCRLVVYIHGWGRIG